MEPSRRWVFLVLGRGVRLVATLGFVGVDADTLFWVRALQVMLLLFVVPFVFATGEPRTALVSCSIRPGGRSSTR
ncbi:cytochrome c oxidase assembly protein [Rhodococcus sp. 27YEA15]|uniref:cytochrome c oxidase assembly protein n=1 Tax=Rhodococcus sp. 27YEA15 TaxID=3156259 RepID=UPI003C7DF608